jgi:RNA-binding protein YhbY
LAEGYGGSNVNLKKMPINMPVIFFISKGGISSEFIQNISDLVQQSGGI